MLNYTRPVHFRGELERGQPSGRRLWCRPGLPGLALCTPGLLHSRGAPGCALKAQLLFARE